MSREGWAMVANNTHYFVSCRESLGLKSLCGRWLYIGVVFSDVGRCRISAGECKVCVGLLAKRLKKAANVRIEVKK